MKRSYSEFLAQGRRETTSLPDELDGFYGRDGDKEAIIRSLLLSDGAHAGNLGVISIVGMAGVGKTTLAQHVFNDEEVAKRFDIRAWVYVSVEFTVLRLTKLILEEVTGRASDSNNLNQLQRKLKDQLDGKKLLLVLDDVWSEDYDGWNMLLTPLRSGAKGAKGSKIIVTTRSKVVASMVETVPTHDLRVLQEEDCSKLFATHARLDVNSAANPPELQEIGKNIVRKCGGLPLAAKALGGVLRRQTKVEKWKEVSESEIWEVQNVNILPALAMSYILLPSHLKRCFAYCAIFPQGYMFEKEELIALWMSEGFLVQRKGKKSLEEIGDRYFDDLVSRSFFQLSSNFGGEQRFAMHDLVHDLARFVLEEFCSRLEDGTSWKIGERTRHLYYGRNEDDGLGIHEPPFLRSFVAVTRGRFDEEFIDGLLQRRKPLRVLRLSCGEIRELSNSIGNLKHMRYLNLSGTSITLLPEAVTDLFNLEILILRGCTELVELPADMARLINLCQLDLSGTRKLKGMPPEMGKLKKLSKLSDFVVGENGGSSIKELGHLHNLRGKFLIRGLENVKNNRDAWEANLKHKKNLKALELKWDWEDDSRQAKQVLGRLQPHTDIESIEIWGYRGREFPNWVGGTSFSNLKELHLFELRNCIRLPPLGQLASLEELSIRGGGYDDDDDDGGGYNEVLEAIGVEFYGKCKPGEKPFSSLKGLYFGRMKNWREWSSCNGAFPVLEELKLHECPQLMSVPNHLPSLKRLRIKGCDKVKCISGETFPNLKELQIKKCSNLESLVGSTATTSDHPLFSHSLPSLKELKLYNCPKLLSVPSHLPSLKCLWIRRCGELESLGSTAAATTTRRTSDPLFSPSLASLHIEGCSELVSFPRGELQAPNLQLMWIEDCGNLKSLPQGMHSLLPSLEELDILDCPNMESFPDGGLPSKLQSLRILGCDKLVGGRMQWGLQSLPCLSSLAITVEDEDVESSFPEETLLPSSLKSLEIIFFANMKSLNYKGLQHLSSLQSLKIRSCDDLKSLPEEGLPSSLPYLYIESYNLLERCEIFIRGLENVQDDWDASEANLKLLQPDTEAESIKISRYGGRKFPNWVGDISFSKLKELHLLELRNCTRLPALGQLASLEELTIRGGGGDEDDDYFCDDEDDVYFYDYGDDDDGGGGYNEVLEAIGVEFYGKCKSGEKPFPSLKRLKFERMMNWTEWSSCNGAFPVLEELQLIDCPQLMSVPSHLPSLIRLRIIGCDEVECISIETFPNLKRLYIKKCSNLESLVGSTATTSDPSFSPSLTSLEELKLCNCPKLLSVPNHIPSLKELWIRRCGELESLVGPTAAATTTRRTSDPLFSLSPTSLPIEGASELVSFPRGELHAPNLKSLIIEECGNLKWLPQGMHSLLPSLEKLIISDCPEIESFPDGGLPSKLQSLEIQWCEKLVGGRMQWGLQSLPSLSRIHIVGGSCEDDAESYEEDVGSFEEDAESCEEDVESHEEEDVESSFPEETLLPSSLKSLEIWGFGKMKSLNYKGLQHLSSLQSLEIWGCENLESLPEEGLPSSLSYLSIERCPLLEKRCEREIGEDWPKIQHIPRLRIGGSPTNR